MATRVRVRRVRISNEIFQQAVNHPKVRAELARIAASLAATATAIARAENADTEITVEHGTRPRGRTYSRVVSSNTDESEWGNGRRKRSRILGRAAGIRI